MKERIFKIVALFLVSVMCLTFCGPSVAMASWRYNRWYNNDYYRDYYNHYYRYNNYYRHYRHHSHWSSKDTWAVVGLGLIAALAINSNHRSNKKYSDKIGNSISNFNADEIQVYRCISNAPSGEVGYLSYDSQEELKAIKNVLKKLYGQYIIMDSYSSSKYGNMVAFYKFTRIYENERISGKYEDFVARELVSNFSRGVYFIDYNKKLFSSLCKVVAQYFPSSQCYRNGDDIVIEKR